jgi:hypothetical protein
MAIQDDFSLNYTTKKISHASGSTRYTVNALYSWLMDLFDDVSQMDDTIPIKANTPTEYELINTWEFSADSDLDYLYGGSIIVNKSGGNDIWANFYTLGSIASGSIVYWKQGTALVASHAGYSSGHIDQLIKVTAAGADTDSKKVSAFIRNLGDTYDHFEVQATATGGRNPVPLATATDLNDDSGTASFGTVTVAFGTVSRDIGDGNGAQNYDVEVDATGYTCAQAYKLLKYHTRRQETGAIGSGNATAGRFYQLANGAYAAVKAAPFGSFAGGKFFGARGVWLKGVTDPMQMQLIDAAGTIRTPPVSIAVAVSGVVSGDRVLVARSSAGVVNKSQFTISSVTSTTIVATITIPTDIPSSGAIRIGDVQYTYTGKSGATFTGVSPSPVGKTGGFYVPLVDAVASGTSISAPSITYLADFDVIARVRKKGILPFENTGTVTNAGLTISAIRTTDTIAV